MSLLGLVRHLADVEMGWFRLNMAGFKLPHHYRTDDNRDAASTARWPTRRWWRRPSRHGGWRSPSPRTTSTRSTIWATSARAAAALREILVHMIE
jgi:hypothetical protein